MANFVRETSERGSLPAVCRPSVHYETSETEQSWVGAPYLVPIS